MGGSPKTVDIDVHIIDDSSKSPPFNFWMDPHDSKVGKSKGENLRFENEGKYDGFDLRFKVVDDTKAKEDFRFMDVGTLANGDPDPDLAPMWVRMADSLGPTEPCPDHEFWDQFETTSVSQNNKMLHVHNKNDDVQKFKFALLFSKNPSQSPCEIMYDPGGDNMDGTKPLFGSVGTITAAAIGGAIVGSLLTLGVQAAIAG